MTNQIINIVNATTGEQIEREMNASELDQLETDKAADKARQAAAGAKQALTNSANAKLAALGLTPEEIAAITA